MARPRKIDKRVTIEMQVDVSSVADYKALKDGIKSVIQSNFNGTLVYLAIDSEDRS